MKKFLLLSGLVFLLSAVSYAALPAAYDLRDYGYSSDVRSQLWGTCWLHGTCAAMESNLLMTGNWAGAGMAGDADLAEYYLDKFNGFTMRGGNVAEGEETHEPPSWWSGQNWPWEGTNTDEPLWPSGEGVWPAGRTHGLMVHCGGDYQIITAHMTNYGGAADETSNTRDITRYPIEQRRIDFGYGPDEGIYQYPENHGLPAHNFFLPRHVEWHTLSGTDEQKRQRIKEAIVNYGAVATCEYYDGGFLGYDSHGYEVYCYTGTEEPDHSHAIIGWDDNFTYGGHTGAWLIKCSSRADYMWRMYDDTWVGKHDMMGGVTFRDVVLCTYDDIYSHSLHGWQYDTGADPTGVTAAANRFVAKQGERLESVGIYTLGDNTTYTIRIHKDNLDGATLREETGSFENPGFHMVDLTGALGLKEGDVFFVVVELSDGGYAFDASFQVWALLGGGPFDLPYEVFSAAGIGESFYKDAAGDWADFQGYDAHNLLGTDYNDGSWNFAINAYASVPEPVTLTLLGLGALGVLIRRKRR